MWEIENINQNMIFLCQLWVRDAYSNKHVYLDIKVMIGNNFVFYFQKLLLGNIKKKTIFLYFLNQKHVWLVEIKKIGFWRKLVLYI